MATLSGRILFYAGSALLLLGCLSGLVLAGAVVHARIEGIFTPMATDLPTARFDTFVCPLLLNSREQTEVSVSIANPITDRLVYSVTVLADGLRVETPQPALTVTIPGGQTARLAWTISAIRPGNGSVTVQAISSQDAALAGPFHAWPTSFRESCGMLVIAGPLGAAHVLSVIAFLIIAGAAMTSPALAARLRAKAS